MSKFLGQCFCMDNGMFLHLFYETKVLLVFLAIRSPLSIIRYISIGVQLKTLHKCCQWEPNFSEGYVHKGHFFEIPLLLNC